MQYMHTSRAFREHFESAKVYQTCTRRAGKRVLREDTGKSHVLRAFCDGLMADDGFVEDGDVEWEEESLDSDSEDEDDAAAVAALGGARLTGRMR